MNFPGGGHNPAFGRDPGPPPPFGYHGGAPVPPDFGPPPPGTMVTAQPPYPYFPFPGAYGGPGQPPMMYSGNSYYRGGNPFYGGGNPYFHQPPPYSVMPPPGPSLGTTMAVDPQGMLYQYISGLNGSGRFPQAPPVIDPDFPAANHINGTGGAGVEPGYNYFFPTEHAKVHVLKCTVPPWLLVGDSYPQYHSAKIPANITMAELLKGFGADNPDPAKNQFWEVYPQGGGLWGKREHCTGDDEIMMARTVRDMGWVEKQEGTVPTTYLWISKG